MKKWILSTVIFCSFITLNVGVIFAENVECEGEKKTIDLLINKKPSTRAPFICPISLFQNGNRLDITFSDKIGMVMIVIINDNSGELVYEELIDSSNQSQVNLNLSSCSKGSYIVNFVCDEIIAYGNFKFD